MYCVVLKKDQTGFSPDLLDMGGGDKVLMGGLMSVDIDVIGGPNFDRLYHKLKVLLLLLLLLLCCCCH